MSRLPTSPDQWLTVQRPITYWSFWWILVRFVPILAALIVLVAVTTDVQVTVDSLAPLPYVFVAASFGYAVRRLNGFGVLISMLLAAVYGFLLWLTEIGTILLWQPTPMLWIITALSFLAMAVGFASPSLHGKRQDREFTRAYREHQLNEEE